MARKNDERRWLTASLIDEGQRIAVAMQILYALLVAKGYQEAAVRAINAANKEGEAQ